MGWWLDRNTRSDLSWFAGWGAWTTYSGHWGLEPFHDNSRRCHDSRGGMHGGKPDTASINQNFTKAGTHNLGCEGYVILVPVELSYASAELANCSYDQALPTSFNAFALTLRIYLSRSSLLGCAPPYSCNNKVKKTTSSNYPTSTSQSHFNISHAAHCRQIQATSS